MKKNGTLHTRSYEFSDFACFLRRDTERSKKPSKTSTSRSIWGKWYEIARFDFRFEKDLDNTTAEYSKKRRRGP